MVGEEKSRVAGKLVEGFSSSFTNQTAAGIDFICSSVVIQLHHIVVQTCCPENQIQSRGVQPVATLCCWEPDTALEKLSRLCCPIRADRARHLCVWSVSMFRRGIHVMI